MVLYQYQQLLKQHAQLQIYVEMVLHMDHQLRPMKACLFLASYMTRVKLFIRLLVNLLDQ